MFGDVSCSFAGAARTVVSVKCFRYAYARPCGSPAAMPMIGQSPYVLQLGSAGEIGVGLRERSPLAVFVRGERNAVAKELVQLVPRFVAQHGVG